MSLEGESRKCELEIKHLYLRLVKRSENGLEQSTANRSFNQNSLDNISTQVSKYESQLQDLKAKHNLQLSKIEAHCLLKEQLMRRKMLGRIFTNHNNTNKQHV